MRLFSGLWLAWLAFAPLLAWAEEAGTQAVAEESVTRLVFDAGLLQDLPTPSVLRYRYDISGENIAEPFTSSATMRVEADGDNKAVHFDLFEGPNRRQFGPISAHLQNPMVLVFLQRDVQMMGRLTGGAANYFQRGLRHAFNKPADVEKVEALVDGKTVELVEVTIRPFAADESINRFPMFRDKTYRFVIGDAVPGGFYRIEARAVDSETGKLILAESFTFDEVVDP